MELSLIRSLMEKQFYEEHRGSRCPMKLFSKDIQKVKRVIDKAMDDYDRSVSPDEVEALFLSDNPTLTTAQKQQYSALFGQIKTQQPMGKDIAQEVLSKLFQQVIGEEVANLGLTLLMDHSKVYSHYVICLRYMVMTSYLSYRYSGKT